MSECYFVEEHGFGPMDKHGYHYSRTTCACGENHKGKLDLAGKNYLYRNDKGQTVIGYHALMDDGEENPIYNKIAEIQYEVYKNIYKENDNMLATKQFYEKVANLVYDRYVKEDSRFSTIIEKFTKDHPQTCEGVAK